MPQDLGMGRFHFFAVVSNQWNFGFCLGKDTVNFFYQSPFLISFGPAQGPLRNEFIVSFVQEADQAHDASNHSTLVNIYILCAFLVKELIPRA